VTVTNTTNLPPLLVAALTDDDYDAGLSDITVTSLLRPPRQVWLERQHPESRDEDAKDMGPALIGKAVHYYIHMRAGQEPIAAILSALGPYMNDGDTEELDEAIGAYSAHAANLNDNRRLYLRVNGWVVGGQTDYVDVDDGHILDYKTTKTTEWTYGLKEEREQQLNMYAELLRSQAPPVAVNRLTACCIFKDFSETKAAFKKDDYPPASIVEIDVPLWPREQAQSYLRERVRAHQSADGDTLCTDEERWMRHEWAVKKIGAARAWRVFKEQDYDSADAAREAAEALIADKEGYEVEWRQGEPIRCRHYCGPGKKGLCAQYNGDGGPQ